MYHLSDTEYEILSSTKKNGKKKKGRRQNMKGYVVENGYMGYLDGKYVLFADESDYEEVYEEQ